MLLTEVASAIGRTWKVPATSGGLSSSLKAWRKEETTLPLPSDLEDVCEWIVVWGHWKGEGGFIPSGHE